MEQSGAAYLDIRLSTSPETLWKHAFLYDVETRLGRPEADEPGVNLEFLWVSRKHARIIRTGTGEHTSYFLENERGRGGIRLYERVLQPGERYGLRHGYVFHIPGVLQTPTDPTILVTFCMATELTRSLAITFGQFPTICIFGHIVKFTRHEYRLLAHLYAHKHEFCPYAEIMAAIWTPKPRTPQSIEAFLNRLYDDPDFFANKKGPFESLLSRVREQIREASGGVSLIETIPGEGLCLRT